MDGTIQSYGSPLVISASDRRLKNNILPVRNALNKISKLRGVYFNWVEDKRVELNLDDRRHIGLLAQDVQEVLPEAVDTVFDGQYLGVNYDALMPLFIEGLHEMSEKKSCDCEERLRLVESQIDSLLSELRALKDEIRNK